MLSHYDLIYLSPHLDDVALSCGGQIHAQTSAGKSVLIVTIMAGDPIPAPITEFARSLHQRWCLVDKTVAGRRQEDQVACQILGADFIHWEIPDCIYRTHPVSARALYVQREDIFGSVQAVEQQLADILAQRLVDLPRRGKLIVPLTVGHHVDHQITRAAAERSTEKALTYYEEYPYVCSEGALAAVILKKKECWQSQVIPLEKRDLRAKIESVAAYASQLSTFFEHRADLEEQIKEYARLVGGERLWFQAGGNSAYSTP
jgi:LmbE family N-acetylglucosaminyl deacetylase